MRLSRLVMRVMWRTPSAKVTSRPAYAESAPTGVMCGWVRRSRRSSSRVASRPCISTGVTVIIWRRPFASTAIWLLRPLINFAGSEPCVPPAHRGGALARLRVHDQRYRTAHRLRPLRSRWRTWSRMCVPRRCGSSERKPVNRLPQCSVQSSLSSGVLVDCAEIEAFTVGHLVVAARREKHRADVCGLGKDAGLLSEREAVVDVVAAVD